MAGDKRSSAKNDATTENIILDDQVSRKIGDLSMENLTVQEALARCETGKVSVFGDQKTSEPVNTKRK